MLRLNETFIRLANKITSVHDISHNYYWVNTEECANHSYNLPLVNLTEAYAPRAAEAQNAEKTISKVLDSKMTLYPTLVQQKERSC